jgi:hypothetical protein
MSSPAPFALHARPRPPPPPTPLPHTAVMLHLQPDHPRSEPPPESEAVRVARIAADAQVRAAAAGAVGLCVGLACLAISICVAAQIVAGAGPKAAVDAAQALAFGLRQHLRDWVLWLGLTGGQVVSHCAGVVLTATLRRAG